MTRINGRGLSLTVAAAVLLAACGGSDDGGESADTDVANTETVEDTATPATDEPGDTAPPDTDPPSTDPPSSESVPDDGSDVASPPTEVTDPRCGVEAVGASLTVDQQEREEDGGIKLPGTFVFDDAPCDEPHDAELAGFAVVDGADIVAEAEQRMVFEQCAEAVRALSGRDRLPSGVEIGSVEGDDVAGGTQYECWLSMTAEDSIVGSLRDVTLDEALGGLRLVDDLADGTCYVEFDDDSFDVVEVVDCSTATEGIGLVATVELTGDEWPGGAAVTEEGFAKCDAAVAELGVGYEILLTPGEASWLLPGVPTARCLDDLSTAGDTGSDDGDGGELQRLCADREDGEWTEVDCTTPHDSQYVGSVEAGVDALPDEQYAAERIGYDACRPLVADYVGRPVDNPGIGLGFDIDAELGGPISGLVDCWIQMSSETAFVGYVPDLGFEAALGDVRILFDLAPGTCFRFVEDSFDLGVVADCGEPDVLMIVGFYDAEDREYPGLDALREERQQRCADVLAASGLAVDVSTLSGTIPNESNWRAQDVRLVSCDAVPA